MDLKKIALSLCALGLTGVASAGGFMHAPECNGQPVSVPCEHSAWDLGITAYWGRLSSNYADMDALGSSIIEPVFLNPSYRLSFGLEASYHWGSGNDLTVNWMHFNKSFEDRFTALGAGSFTATDDLVINHARYKLDAVNFELGQQLDVGARWDMRAHAGLQYLKVKRELDYRAGDPADFPEGDFTQNLMESRFKGIGPRAGLNSAYHLSGNWNLVGDAAVSILSGRVHADATIGDFSNFVFSPADISRYNRKNILVAGLDGKLGLRYDMAIASGNVSLTGGYAASIFMSPLKQTSIIDYGKEWTDAYMGVGSFFVTAKYIS